MARSFHPSPVVAAVKIVIYVVAFTALLALVQNLIRGIFLQLLLFVWLAGFALLLLAFIRARFQTITLDDNTITYTGGVLATKKSVLPYARITETSYTQGLLERLLGVGTVSIDNAGGPGVAIRMYNVRYSDIKLLLQEINAKTGKGSGI
jgi:uncharacterized membrane protein YdbT with pleckstrin-like domain